MNEYEKENPYAKRVAVVYEIIRNIRWKIPFLPQIVQFLVLSIQLLVLCALYCTIGIVYNCDWLFRKLLAETTEEYKKTNDWVYALMAGGYLLLVIPCWLILAPFYLSGKIWWMLGWVWQLLCRMSWYGLILYVPLLGLLVFVVIYHDEVFDWCRNLVGHGPSVSQEIKVGE